MTDKPKHNQSILDIAIEKTGSVESYIDILTKNGLESIQVPIDQELSIDDSPVNSKVTTFFKQASPPASGEESDYSFIPPVVAPPQSAIQNAILKNSDDDLISTTPVSIGVDAEVIAPDEDITVNGSPFITKPSVKDIDISLVDQDDVEIDPISIVGGVVKVNTGGDPPIGFPLMKTGQLISYRTGDDGDLQHGRSGDFFTLGDVNPFNNLNRFTDLLGEQTFANGVMIDWSTFYNGTVLGWQIGSNGSDVTWDDAVDYPLTLTLAGYDNWFLPNDTQLNTLKYTQATRSFNWSPMNDSGNARYWTSTDVPVISGWAAIVPNQFYGVASAAPKTTSGGYRAKACRVFTVNGTTLT